MTVADDAADGAPGLLTPQEWARRSLEVSLLRQDQAREVLRPKVLPPPGDGNMEAEDTRKRALQEASMHSGAQLMGRDVSGEAMVLPNGALVSVTRKNGAISEMRAGGFQGEVVGPAQWDAHDRIWQARKRAGENRMLAAYYGRQVCIDGGLFTEAEADAARIPPDPEPGSVAYRVRNSVR